MVRGSQRRNDVPLLCSMAHPRGRHGQAKRNLTIGNYPSSGGGEYLVCIDPVGVGFVWGWDLINNNPHIALSVNAMQSAGSLGPDRVGFAIASLSASGVLLACRKGSMGKGARSRLMQRNKFCLEANSQFERCPHFCYERPLGRARAQRTHSQANGSRRHVDTARANRSADRWEELVRALRIPFADLYGECFRLDTMPRARAGGMQRGVACRS
jgi:hypothetical protein